MPPTITFGDHFGMELPDDNSEINDDHDSIYNPDGDLDNDTSTHNTDDGSKSSSDYEYFADGDSYSTDDDNNDNLDAPLSPTESTGVEYNGAPTEPQEEDQTDNGKELCIKDAYNSDEESYNQDEGDPTPVINNDIELSEIPGVGITGVGDNKGSIEQEMDQRYGPQQHDSGLCVRGPPKYDHLSKWTRPDDWVGPQNTNDTQLHVNMDNVVKIPDVTETRTEAVWTRW